MRTLYLHGSLPDSLKKTAFFRHRPPSSRFPTSPLVILSTFQLPVRLL
jgi:hypothetical protein